MKKIIRLTEQDLHKIVKQVVSEAFQSNILRNLHNSTPSYTKSIAHGGNDFSNHIGSDAEAHGLPTRNGLYTHKYLDKITDDMIETVGTREELSRQGFTFGSHRTHFGIGSQEVYDQDGDRRYTMMANNGQLVVFRKDPETIQKIKTLGDQAGEQLMTREKNRRNDGKDTYNWSTKQRGDAFRDWKNTGRGLWDNPEFRKEYPGVKNWRQDSWVKDNMNQALKSYKK